jgi:hypothetical protein
MSLLAKLKAGTTNHKIVKFPGTEENVRVRLLSTDETQLANIECEQWLKKENLDVTPTTIHYLEQERNVRQLFRALRNEEGDAGLADSLNEFRSLMTLTDLDFFAQIYQSIEAESSVNPFEMDEQKFESLVADVKKNAKMTIGNITDISTLKKLCLTLASRPTK